MSYCYLKIRKLDLVIFPHCVPIQIQTFDLIQILTQHLIILTIFDQIRGLNFDLGVLFWWSELQSKHLVS